MTSAAGLHGFNNSNLQQTASSHHASSFPQKTQEFQNVAQFLKQQREEELLAENNNEQMGVDGQAGGESSGNEDDEDDDVEIQEMKAKFNQILANFDQEQHQGTTTSNSAKQTGYFKGGVPQ